jgi:hypothetical protein
MPSFTASAQVVRDLAVQHRGEKVRGPPLDLVRLPGVALQQGRAGRLSRDDGDFGPRQANHVARAGDGPTGTVPADVIVQPPVGEILEDLRAGRVGVIGRIRLVFELLRHEPAVFGGQRLRDAHHPGGPLRGRREHD